MSRRMAAMDGESIQVTRTVAIPVSEIELRFSRSSGPGAQPGPEGARDPQGGAGAARGRPGRAQPAAEPRARDRAARRVAARSTPSSPPPPPDETYSRFAATPPRAEAPPRRDEAATPEA